MLDKQLDALLAPMRAAGVPDLCDLPLPAARAMYTQIMSASAVLPIDGSARDLALPAPLPPMRLYTPASSPAAGRLPLVLWFHGGGYALGGGGDYDALCRRLAADSGAALLAVDYRLVPEHPCTAVFDDAFASLRWAASPAAADMLGAAVDTSRLALAGDSAGAVLALAACLQARDAGDPVAMSVRALALAYPPAAGGHGGDFPSRQRHAAGPTLTLRTMDWFSRLAFGESGHAADLRAAPLLARSLAGLPPLLLQLAAHDPLRDEGVALARRLLDDGSAVALVEYHGLAHGFLAQGAVVAAARAAQRQFGQWLGDMLAPR